MAVQGITEFRRQLMVRIPDRVYKQVGTAMEQGADEMVQMMRNLAPRDTGRLAASITWIWGSPQISQKAAKNLRSNKTGLYLTIYTPVFYAPFQEFGTRVNAAQPFFFPSYRVKKKSVKARISRALRNAIKGAAGAGALVDVREAA